MKASEAMVADPHVAVAGAMGVAHLKGGKLAAFARVPV